MAIQAQPRQRGPARIGGQIDRAFGPGPGGGQHDMALRLVRHAEIAILHRHIGGAHADRHGWVGGVMFPQRRRAPRRAQLDPVPLPAKA